LQQSLKAFATKGAKPYYIGLYQDVLTINMKYITKLLLILSALFSIALSPAYALPAYLIGPGDVLQIAVWKEDGLQQEVLVRPDGEISFPLAGQLKAGGKTTSQLQKELVNKIKKFIPDPVINVSIIKITNNKVFVIGKVNRPGEFIASHYIDVMQALTMAGGLNAYAKTGDVKILRRVNDKEISIPFEYDEVAQGDELQQNIILQSGDVVVVP